MATFNYGNAIVDMLFAVNDLASDYSNEFDYSELIEASFIEFVDSESGVIESIEDADIYMSFVDSVSEMIEVINNDISGDDDIDDIFSAINTMINILLDI